MRLPIATQLVTRDGSLAKDALMVNALAEVKGQDNVLAFKRPGLALKMDFTPGAGQGIVCWRGTLYAVSGNVITQGPTENPWPDGSAWTKVLSAATLGVVNPSAWSVIMDSAHYGCMPRSTSGELWAFLNDNAMMRVSKSSDGFTFTTVGSFSVTTQFTVPVFGTPSSGNAGAGPSMQFAELGGVWYCFASYTTGGGAGSPTNFVFSSPDGLTWTRISDNPLGGSARRVPNFVRFKDKLWVISGNDPASAYFRDAWSSTDGISWVQESTNIGLASGQSISFIREGYTVGDSEYLYSFGSTPTANDAVWRSLNGSTWSLVTEDTTFANDLQYAVANSTVSKKFYCAPNEAKTSVYTASETDLSTWQQKTSGYGGQNIHRLHVFGANVFAYALNAGGTAMDVWKSTNNQNSDATYAIAAAVDKPVSIVSNSAAAATQYLFIKTTDFAWVLTFGNPGTLTQVTDVDYPAATVPGAVFLDGYIFVMGQDGTIFNSDLENPTSWNSLNFIRAEIEPDFGVAIAKHNDYILAFKQFSLEFFYDADNATGSPLSPLPSSAQKIGCANGDSVAEIDGGIYFLSRTTSQQPSVHWFQKGSLTPQEVATEDVQRFLAQADLTSVRSWAGRFSGHALYVLTLKTEGVTLVYDATSQHWSTFTYRTASAAKSVSVLTQANGVATATCTGHGFLDGDPVTVAGATPSGYNGAVNVTVIDSSHFSYFVDPALGATASGTITATGSTESYFPFAAFTACGGKNYVQHETAADVFELSQAYTDDAGAAIDMRCRSMKFDGGTLGPKTMAGAVIVSEETTGNLLLRWSDDDYATFSPYRQIALQQRKPETRNLGRFRRRAFEFRYTGSGAPRLAGIEPEIGG